LANVPWLGLLCLPIFLSAILGIKFGKEQTKYPRTSKMEIRKSSPAEIAAAA